MLLFIAVAFFVESAPLSESDLKNLLAGIRANRTTQADFQEERVMRLMKKPIVSSGKIWFQPPNKFRREVKGNSPSITVSDGRQLWIYYPNFKNQRDQERQRVRPNLTTAHSVDETSVSKA